MPSEIETNATESDMDQAEVIRDPLWYQQMLSLIGTTGQPDSSRTSCHSTYSITKNSYFSDAIVI